MADKKSYPDGWAPGLGLSTLKFHVAGTPRPGGSKRGFVNPKSGKVLMVKAGGEKEESWRQAVAHAAVEAMEGRDPFLGPLTIAYAFVMPRPKKHYHTSKKRMGELRAGFAGQCPHIIRPDRGKLLRSTEDALSGVLFADDSQVWAGSLTKTYGPKPGCQIIVWYQPQKYPEGDPRCLYRNAEACIADCDYSKGRCPGAEQCEEGYLPGIDMAGLDEPAPPEKEESSNA